MHNTPNLSYPMRRRGLTGGNRADEIAERREVPAPAPRRTVHECSSYSPDETFNPTSNSHALTLLNLDALSRSGVNSRAGLGGRSVHLRKYRQPCHRAP